MLDQNAEVILSTVHSKIMLKHSLQILSLRLRQKFASVIRMSNNHGAELSIEEIARLSQLEYTHDEEESCDMKKTILVWGLPGPQASSVAIALVGNPLFTVRGIFNKNCPEVARFQQMGVESEIVEISEKGPIPIIKLNNVFRDVYGVFFVTNDIDPLLPMRREMEVGVKLAEMCERLRIKHVIYSAVDFVYRITGNRCSRYDGKGEIEYQMKGMGLPLTVLKLPLSYDYLVNTLIPTRQGSDYVFTGIVDSKLDFDVMNYSDIGPVVKLAFERPNIFIGKTIGLTVDRIDINKFVQLMTEVFKETKIDWRYEKLSWKEYQRDKKNNRELATLLDFHCNYAPLRDVRTMQALNPNVQTFSEYISANQKRLTKLFKLVKT
ncbi:nmrA-like family domain-containing protein 1 isoform X1 [Bolinopsis microptera]|uniref:nmrA-like family domain-containing protein 1 isoform X1 n=2 Tax=Bolinopsis microptera TaxID=2820187 RepID=UPI00307A3061